VDPSVRYPRFVLLYQQYGLRTATRDFFLKPETPQI
jgi:hypothetical protein